MSREKIMRCPICKSQLEQPLVRNSVSRYANIYICSDCGVREALQGNFWKNIQENIFTEIRNAKKK